MVPCDTIGAAAGDSCYTFGMIGKVEAMPGGGVAVLDQMAGRLLFYDSLGVFQGLMGGRGSGPGEFLMPTSFTFLDGGGLAVSDWSARTVWIFDDSLEFRGDLGQFDPGAPSVIESAGGDRFAGQGMIMEMGEDGLEGESILGLWDGSPEPVAVFHASPLIITASGEDRIDIGYQRLVFDADEHGNVYMAPVSDSTFSVRGFRSTGEPFLEIDCPWERIARTDAEISLERSLAGPYDDDPEIPEYRNAIEGLFVSGSGDIWVRMGSSLYPEFRVYSVDGELLHTAEIPSLKDTLFSLQFAAAGPLLAAWDSDPPDYPKVILLEPEAGIRI
jgi:hypothetical protein